MSPPALDHSAILARHVKGIACIIERDDLFDLAILEIDAGAIVAGIAGLEFAGADLGPVKRPSARFGVIMRAMAAAHEAQPLDGREFARARVGGAMFEPA